jgi:hypothetical protein
MLSFSKLLDQLKSYSTSTDPLFYTMRFIDGLRPELKATILVSRPKTLDAAIATALVQEEVGNPASSRSPLRTDWPQSGKFPPKTALPLPPPPRNDRPPPPSTAAMALAPSSTDAKVAPIKTYRRALGLCFHCGEKWRKEHTCSPQVQLHVVQELWDLILSGDSEASPSSPTTTKPQVFLAISQGALNGSPAPRTVQFTGSIQIIQLQMLLDSGSSSSFLSESVAAKLQNVSV